MNRRSARGRRWSVWACLVLIGSTLFACGSDDAPSRAEPRPSATPAPVEGLTATVGTNRLYQPRRELGLALANLGDEPTVVTGIRLESDLFEPAPVARREVVLQPGGRRLVLPLPYGAARCDGEPVAEFAATVVLEGGRELVVPAPEEYDGAVERLHARECAAAQVREAVEVAFEGAWRREGNSISGTLSLSTRSAGPEVVMEDVVGNVIFTVRTEQADGPVLEVTNDRRRATAPVTISADRCDSHAVAEFKRPFVFLSWIRVGDEPATPVELEPDGAARQALERLLASC